MAQGGCATTDKEPVTGVQEQLVSAGEKASERACTSLISTVDSFHRNMMSWRLFARGCGFRCALANTW